MLPKPTFRLEQWPAATPMIDARCRGSSREALTLSVCHVDKRAFRDRLESQSVLQPAFRIFCNSSTPPKTPLGVLTR